MKEHNKEQSGLGASVRQAREAAGLSLWKLAELADMSIGYLSKIENGQNENPSAELLQRIADACEIDSTDLLAFVGVTQPQGLPSVGPYLRARYNLHGPAADKAAEEIQRIIEKYNDSPPDQ